ncbi:hypothetical protein [Magnetospirillum sulfuroxidans]|uniref:Tetratricopeptide repeat protein n=1 Tax=Magnetospirillum sulfuroxidans TaxID=611300 RepID=A0ABS5IFR0_9PROT|nr:hypothetical protein [Magnetospirillum sulfuroxidans]MBR9973017.1 hypothetical protein [Magnetospirillum sulfuroxidans]
MRVSLFVFLLLLPVAAAAAPGDSVETRLRLLEQRQESQKDDAKSEAMRVETRLLDRVGSLELTVNQQNSHVDQVLSQLNLTIAIGGIFIAAVALLGAWKAVSIAKAEARETLREMLGEVSKAKTEVEALLKEVRQGHGEVMSKAAELKAAGTAPENFTPDDKASIAAAAQQAAAKPASQRTEIDIWALAQQAILRGDSGQAADHLADADESKPWTWVLRARVKSSQGDWAGTRRDAETALRLARQQNDREQEGLALEVLEYAHSAHGDWPKAKAVCMEALQISRELAAAEPENSRKQSNLAVSLRRLGQFCLGRGEVEEARGHVTEAVTISRRFHDNNPASVDGQKQLARSDILLGTVCLEEGKWTEAKIALTEAISISQDLLADDPVNTELLYQLGQCWTRLGLVARMEDDWQQARACAVEYRVLAERLASLDPRNAQWQTTVAYARRDNAVCDDQFGHLAIAQAGYRAAIQRLQTLDGQGKLAADDQKLLEECQRKLAAVEKKMAEKGDV